ncbi:MAG: hypothetical protein LBB13_00910, partial [Rickettsiales bacterium]|nr:hypothetical protein [Rickettsiales bacterium]
MVKLANFIFRSSLALVAIFAVVTMARAEPTEVNNFDELKDAINNAKTEIVIKNDIDFTANVPEINYNNIVISGPSENAQGLLNGNGNYKFFMFGVKAKNISLKNLHLSDGNNKDESSISNGGGAIHLGKEVVVNLEGLTFSNNQTISRGGAIHSRGTDNDNKNNLNFTGETTFSGNKTVQILGNGGAIYAENSSLTFGKLLATFENNSSKNNGGAIYGGNGTELTFGGDVTFTENSSDGNGGAIHFWGENATNKNILEFEGNATFVRNSTTKDGNGYGGAIYIWDSSLTFGGLATLESNRAKFGGAICARMNTSIKFNNGLRLIGNTTGNKNSGALHILGSSNDELAIITIIQRNPAVPTEFRGNKSGDGEHNAVYMTQYSRLNFFVEKGSVNIFDVFSGKKDGPDNIITINEGDGWINIEKGGSLENVRVVSGGNLKLAGESRGFNLIDFTNSGTIRFEILPGKINAKINADSITLKQGTVLEIVAVKGQLYQTGESYDILAIDGKKNNKTINGQENSKLISLQRDLKIEGGL